MSIQIILCDPRAYIADKSSNANNYALYPEQKFTFNMFVSTRTMMQKALENRLAITKKIMIGKTTWDKLFEKHIKFF